jgi:transposase-like protein
MAVVIAVDVNQDGQREMLGLNVGPSEDGGVRLQFEACDPFKNADAR